MPLQSPTKNILVLGHITRDRIEGQERLGGAASFAARALSRMGQPCTLVTAARAGEPLLQPLRNDPRIELHSRTAPHTTTFRLVYHGSHRSLSLEAQAPSLSPQDLPSRRSWDMIYVAPVVEEWPWEDLDALQARVVVLGLQGWLRHATSDGALHPKDPPQLGAPPTTTATILSEHDHPQAQALAQRYARQGVMTVLTRGERGALLMTAQGMQAIPAAPAEERDPTGAGDVFGAIFALGLAQNLPPPEAARQAAFAAARVVEGPGMGSLGAVALS